MQTAMLASTGDSYPRFSIKLRAKQPSPSTGGKAARGERQQVAGSGSPQVAAFWSLSTTVEPAQSMLDLRYCQDKQH